MDKNIVIEPARELEIAGSADVIVCGGGPAGIAAALGAARNGASTMLIESAGCLGGIWSTGLLSWLIDCDNKKTGLIAEILADMEARGVAQEFPASCGSMSCEPEYMKYLMEKKCLDAGVDILLHTRVSSTIVKDDNITHVVTESKSGRQAYAGKIFIDCTGDGDLGALAGCGFDFGSPDGKGTQPMSLLTMLTGIEMSEVGEFVAHGPNPGLKPYELLRAELERAGVSPSYTRSTLFKVYDNMFTYMGNHQYGVSGLDVRDITRATLEARAELQSHIEGLRSLGGPWKNIRLAATSASIGVREGRRIHGLYQVSLDDLLEGKEHPDGICKVRFGVDIHAMDPSKGKGISKESGRYKVKPYDIPLRALISRDRTNMMMAGRCISGDFFAHASYRVVGDAVPCGEAAGQYAAKSVKEDKTPSEVAAELL